MSIASRTSKLLASGFLIAQLLVPVAAAQEAQPSDQPGDGTMNPASGITIAYEPLGPATPGSEVAVAVATNRQDGLCTIELNYSNGEAAAEDGADDDEGLGLATQPLDSEGRCAWTVNLPADAPTGPTSIDVTVVAGARFNTVLINFDIVAAEEAQPAGVEPEQS